MKTVHLFDNIKSYLENDVNIKEVVDLGKHEPAAYPYRLLIIPISGDICIVTVTLTVWRTKVD